MGTTHLVPVCHFRDGEPASQSSRYFSRTKQLIRTGVVARARGSGTRTERRLRRLPGDMAPRKHLQDGLSLVTVLAATISFQVCLPRFPHVTTPTRANNTEQRPSGMILRCYQASLHALYSFPFLSRVMWLHYFCFQGAGNPPNTHRLT